MFDSLVSVLAVKFGFGSGSDFGSGSIVCLLVHFCFHNSVLVRCSWFLSACDAGSIVWFWFFGLVMVLVLVLQIVLFLLLGLVLVL